jgi:hypothetical protein
MLGVLGRFHRSYETVDVIKGKSPAKFNEKLCAYST